MTGIALCSWDYLPPYSEDCGRRETAGVVRKLMEPRRWQPFLANGLEGREVVDNGMGSRSKSSKGRQLLGEGN